MIKWIINLFRSKDRLSDQWLYEHTYKEASEGWKDAPRWRFPSEVTEQARLERKRKISIVRAKITENKEQRRA